MIAADYENYIQMLATADGGGGMDEIDVENLPDESVLLQPGGKDGEIKVVRVASKGE